MAHDGRQHGTSGTGTATGLADRVVELVGYLGAAFVVSAAGILLASRWSDWDTGERVGWLAGIAVVLAAAGAGLLATAVTGLDGVRRGADPVRCRLVGVLLTGAAAATAASVGVGLEPRVSDTTTGLVASAVLTVLSLSGYLLAPTVVGQLGVAVGLSTVVPVTLHRLDVGSSPVVGAALLAVGALWLVAAERRLWQEVGSARVLGCLLALNGAQLPVLGDGHQAWGYLFTAVLAGGALTAYAARPAWQHLALGIVAVTLVVPEALTDWTDDAFGPAGILLVTGATLLAVAVLGLRLRREAVPS